MAHDTALLQQLYEIMLGRRIALLKAAAGSEDCSVFSHEQCADYLDLIMPASERDCFEQHYPDCIACLDNLVTIIEADQQCESDPHFTEIGQRLSQRKVLSHVAQTRLDTEPQLLAAAARHQIGRRAAAGVAIDPRNGRGQILECVAHIYDDSSAEPGLQVIGCQVVEREIGGRRVGVTPPLRMIQDVLSVICKSNTLFKKHCASERSITVQVTQTDEGFLSEGLSLSLAAAAAVYAAFEDIALPDDLVMSGCLEITGRIRKVSHVREKAALAVQHGKTIMVLACENMADIEQLDPALRSSLSFSFVDTLPELFEYLASLAPAANGSEPATQQSASLEGGRIVERLYRLDKYPLSVGALIAVLCAGWLSGYFKETTDCFLGFWSSSGAPSFMVPTITALLCVCFFVMAAQPDHRAGFLNRMFLYIFFLLLIPSGIASLKNINSGQQIDVNRALYEVRDPVTEQEQSEQTQIEPVVSAESVQEQHSDSPPEPIFEQEKPLLIHTPEAKIQDLQSEQGPQTLEAQQEPNEAAPKPELSPDSGFE